MANGIRVLLRPVLQKWAKGELVSGLTIGLELFGKGPEDLAKGEAKPAKLLLHRAFLANAKDEAKKKAAFEKFATLSGNVQLKGGKPVFVLDPKGKFEYEQPEPAKPTFRRIAVGYESAFEGRPVPPVSKPGEQPPEPHPLSILRLPEEPKGMRFMIVGAELEISGAKSSDVKQNDQLDVPLTPIRLVITKVDPHFAPSVEMLDIKYQVGGLQGSTVTLEITSKNYASGPIFKRTLTPAELQDGVHTIQWNGKCNPSAGELKDRFVTPLFGPFEIKLADGAKHEAKGKFKVLYHSLELHHGVHTPDGKTPVETDKIKFGQAKLNQLGYDAGPVNGTDGAILQNAVKRFQRANYKSGTVTRLAQNGTLDADTIAALKSAAPRQRFESGVDPLATSCKFYVEDNYFNDDGGDFVTGGTPEFDSEDRKAHVEDKLERPYIPLEVSVKLMGKNKKGVFVADAVGPVPIAWEALDAPEDDRVVTAAANPEARLYVQRARRVGTSASASGARIDRTGDNAPKSLDGFREAAPADNIKSWFPSSADSELKPYKVYGYGQEIRNKVTFHRALVKVWDHATDNPDRRGKAGVYFRHSFKAGDDARVRASITFEGLANKADLDKMHGWKTPPFAQAGRWTVWRRARLSAYCQQTVPSRASGAPNWATIAKWWREAFIEMEKGGQPLATLNYQALISEAVYKATITGMPASHRPPGAAAAASLTYRPGSVYGGRRVVQAPAEPPDVYVARAISAMEAWAANPINALLGKLHDHVRRTSPEGLIIYDFRVCEPVTGQDWDPALNGGRGGFTPSANPAVQNVTSQTPGYVRLGGAVTMNVDNVYNVNGYVLHECGHARFLYHHKTGGGGVGDPSDNATHHDAAQERCAMSYGVNPFTPDTWTYPFCGKCLLRLRGWKVTTLPSRYTP